MRGGGWSRIRSPNFRAGPALLSGGVHSDPVDVLIGAPSFHPDFRRIIPTSRQDSNRVDDRTPVPIRF